MFNPRSFFGLAQKLLTSTPDEAECRTAITRAYYSCFLVARDQMFDIDQSRLTSGKRKRISRIASSKRTRQLGSHDLIIAAVANHGTLKAARAKRLSDQLSELRDMRVQADYFRNPQNPNTVSVFARYAVSDWEALAHFAMTLASNLLPDLQRIPRFA